MGDGNGEHVKVVFDIDVHHVHEWERLRGLDGGRKRWNLRRRRNGRGCVAGKKKKKEFSLQTDGRTDRNERYSKT